MYDAEGRQKDLGRGGAMIIKEVCMWPRGSGKIICNPKDKYEPKDMKLKTKKNRFKSAWKTASESVITFYASCNTCFRPELSALNFLPPKYGTEQDP